MSLEQGSSKEGRLNPLTRETVVLYKANQSKGPIAALKRFIRWPVKLSPQKTQQIIDGWKQREAEELFGPDPDNTDY